MCDGNISQIAIFTSHMGGDLHYSDSVIIEDRGYIFGREFVRGVGYQKTCFANGTVPHNDTPS